MYCSKCGKENENGSAFCRYCGQKLGEAPTPKAERKPVDKKVFKRIIALVIVLAVAVSAGILGYNYYVGEKPFNNKKAMSASQFKSYFGKMEDCYLSEDVYVGLGNLPDASYQCQASMPKYTFCYYRFKSEEAAKSVMRNYIKSKKYSKNNKKHFQYYWSFDDEDLVYRISRIDNTIIYSETGTSYARRIEDSSDWDRTFGYQRDMEQVLRDIGYYM